MRFAEIKADSPVGGEPKSKPLIQTFLVTIPFSLLPFPFSVVVGLDYGQFRVGTLLHVVVPSLETPRLVGVCRLYINIITTIRIKLEGDPIFTSTHNPSYL